MIVRYYSIALRNFHTLPLPAYDLFEAIKLARSPITLSSHLQNDCCNRFGDSYGKNIKENILIAVQFITIAENSILLLYCTAMRYLHCILQSYNLMNNIKEILEQ